MIIQPVLCSFHQLFRNDPQGTVLQKMAFSTNDLVMTIQEPYISRPIVSTSHLGIHEKAATRRQRISTNFLE